MQIEARVDQQTEISRELSLWGQMGSRVIRGNLLVIPVGDARAPIRSGSTARASLKSPKIKGVIICESFVVFVKL